MNQKSIMVAVATLIIGLLIGVSIGGSKAQDQSQEMTRNDSGMDHAMDDMTSRLSTLTESEFEKAFLEEMIVHHEGAVAMAQQVLSKSNRPELLKLANDIINAQTQEISMMQGWLTNWFK